MKIPKLLAAAAVSASLTPSARAAISYFNIEDQVLTPDNTLFFDFDNGLFQLNGGIPPEADVKIRFPTTEYQYINFQNNSDWRIADNGSYYSIRYLQGAAMDFNSLQMSAYIEFENSGPWDGDTGVKAYLGLRNTVDNREAWIGLLYNDALSSLTITDFAVAPGTDNLTAGAVPEPMETGILMALLAGGAALYRRRSLASQKQAV